MIVDRSATARRRLSIQLRALRQSMPMQIVADAVGEHPRAADILQKKPALVVLDAMLPDGAGLALARDLRLAAGGPEVILIVPGEDLAAQANDIDLVACLRRPVRHDALVDALHQAERRLASRRADAGLAPRAAQAGIEVIDRGQARAIDLDDVLYLRADAKYVLVHTRQGTFLSERSLAALLSQHDKRLLRVRRNTLVARHAIQAARRVPPAHHDPDADAYWELLLTDWPQALPVARRQWTALRRAMPELPITDA